MKTYITYITGGKGLVATLANNKKEAYSKIKEAGYKVNKTSILISSVHLDYITGIKVK